MRRSPTDVAVLLVLAIFVLVLFLALISGGHTQGLRRDCVGVVNAQGVMNCVEGWLPFQIQALSSPTVQIKTGSGKTAHIACYNPSAATAFVSLFDVTSSGGVVLGTTSAVITMGVPSLKSMFYGFTDDGILFQRGISAAATTTAGGSTAPASGLVCNLEYN